MCALRERNACRTRNHCFPRPCHPWAMHGRHSEGQTSSWGILQVHEELSAIVLVSFTNYVSTLQLLMFILYIYPILTFYSNTLLKFIWCRLDFDDFLRWKQSQMFHHQLNHLSMLIKTCKPDQRVLHSIGHVRFIVKETGGYLQYIDIVSKLVSLRCLFLSEKPVLCWKRRWKRLISLCAHVVSGKPFPGFACFSWI